MNSRIWSTIFAVLAILLVLFGTALGFGKAFHMELLVDTERISPTIAGADQRTELDLIKRLQAFEADEDFSLPELYDPESGIGRRISMLQDTEGVVQELMDYLGSYDPSLGADAGMFSGFRLLLDLVQTAKLLLTLLLVLIGICLLLSILKLVQRRQMAALLLTGIGAILVRILPPGLLSLFGICAPRLREAAAAAARYGIGFSATVSLTAIGMAQTLFAAAALLIAAAGLFTCRQTGSRGKSPTKSTNH